MTKDTKYHRQRERQCRDMADHSPSADIRRLHEELAGLHVRKLATKKRSTTVSA